ncbi:MAG: IS110 family transposase [Candidatus Aminicenantaceae bacterium]
MNYIGIDHHRQYSHITLLDEKGEKLNSARVANLCGELENFLSGVEEVRAVVEAGRSSYTMVDILDDMGIEVTVAHPKEVKSIAKAKIKTDKRDSWILAHLLRTDLIPEVYKRSRENRSYQRVLRQRAFYVGSTTRVKNRIQALLSQQPEDIRSEISRVKNLFSTEGMKVLVRVSLPAGEKELVDALLKTYRHLDERRKETNGLVEKLYFEIPEARLIHTVPGFGVFLSLLTAVEIADIGRFENERKLHSYAGVIPSTYSSGERTYHGKIIKQGNRWLRWAVVEAVWPAIRADFDVRCYYERLKRKKGANSAKVATARRLLTIIYRMLEENRFYIPYKR